jgi:hypothetical protein
MHKCQECKLFVHYQELGGYEVLWSSGTQACAAIVDGARRHTSQAAPLVSVTGLIPDRLLALQTVLV